MGLTCTDVLNQELLLAGLRAKGISQMTHDQYAQWNVGEYSVTGATRCMLAFDVQECLHSLSLPVIFIAGIRAVCMHPTPQTLHLDH